MWTSLVIRIVILTFVPIWADPLVEQTWVDMQWEVHCRMRRGHHTPRETYKTVQILPSGQKIEILGVGQAYPFRVFSYAMGLAIEVK